MVPSKVPLMVFQLLMALRVALQSAREIRTVGRTNCLDKLGHRITSFRLVGPEGFIIVPRAFQRARIPANCFNSSS